MSSHMTEGPHSQSGGRHSLGIVLSGGGSRGIAHIGALRALRENGIEPDCIAGVSAGAVVGALYAAGHSPAKMMEFFEAVDPYRLNNVSFAKPGILDTQKLVPEFRRYFPVDSFEGLPRRLRILATDLFSGERTIFESGPLILPVLASSSVPMVFSPTEINGRWYSDGGIIDNFPVELVTGCCETVLGVHVSPLREMAHTELTTSLSVLERAMEVGMFAKALDKFEQCDLVIQPMDLTRFGMFDTKHYTDIESAGYAATQARMTEIKQALGLKGLGEPQQTISCTPGPHAERPPGYLSE